MIIIQKYILYLFNKDSDLTQPIKYFIDGYLNTKIYGQWLPYSVHLGINLLPHPLFFSNPPLIKPSKCPSSPFFLGNSPPIFGSLWTPPPLKPVFSVNRHIKFSSLTLSHLLKATKFLANISQFKFLVMTEKNIFVYKPFLSLNI